jgi:hypothetical protein
MEGPTTNFLFDREIDHISLQVCQQNRLGIERKRVYLNIKFKDAKSFMNLTFYLTSRHREHKDLDSLFNLQRGDFIGYGHARGETGASKKSNLASMMLRPINEELNEYYAVVSIGDWSMIFEDVSPENLNAQQTRKFIAGDYWYSSKSANFDLEAYARSVK